MQWWEVQPYINGMRRRTRTQWETARFIAWAHHLTMGGKGNSQQDLITFPWEKEQLATEEERIAKESAELLLAEQCRQANNKQQS